jgi:hypothetical protein
MGAARFIIIIGIPVIVIIIVLMILMCLLFPRSKPETKIIRIPVIVDSSNNTVDEGNIPPPYSEA